MKESFLKTKIRFMKKLTSDSIVGFTDGEGCFSLDIYKRKNTKFGFLLTPSFSLSQNTTSKHVLEEIQTFFDCGFIRKDRKTSKYEVRDLKQLREKIIPFFKRNQLRTQKNQDFLIFCEICDLLKEKQHLTLTGMLKLISLAYSMNTKGQYRRKTKAQLFFEIENYLKICDKVKV